MIIYDSSAGMDPFFSSHEVNEDTMGLVLLFSTQEDMEDTEERVPFKCLHDREEFSELDDFLAHNKEFHRGFKKRCKVCHNVFREKKQIKAHVKKFHENDEFACIHDGRCFQKINGFHLHNNDCHRKFRQVCPHSKCSNVFNGEHTLQLHLLQEHQPSRGRSCHKMASRQRH